MFFKVRKNTCNKIQLVHLFKDLVQRHTNFLLQVFLFSSLLALGSCLSMVLHLPRNEALPPKVPIEPRDDDVDTSKLPPIEPRNVDIITIDPKEEITSKLPPIEPRNGVETTSKPCVSPPCCPNCPPGRWGCYCQFYHDPRRSDEEAQETTSKKPCFEIDPPCCPSCPPGYMGCYCENYHEPRSDQEVSLKLP